MPGGPLTSRPAWRDTPPGVSRHAGFFFARDGPGRPQPQRKCGMDEPDPITAQRIAEAATVAGKAVEAQADGQPSTAQRIAEAAIAFEQQRTGHAPRSVAVVLGGETL